MEILYSGDPYRHLTQLDVCVNLQPHHNTFCCQILTFECETVFTQDYASTTGTHLLEMCWQVNLQAEVVIFSRIKLAPTPLAQRGF